MTAPLRRTTVQWERDTPGEDARQHQRASRRVHGPADHQRLVGNSPRAALEQQMRRPQRRRRRFRLCSGFTAGGTRDRQVIDERQRVGAADRGFLLKRAERSGAARQELDLAIAQRAEALEQSRKRRDARREPQLDLHACDARALHEAQQLDIVRFECGDHLRALDLDLQRPVAELHADDDLAPARAIGRAGRATDRPVAAPCSRRAADRSASCE